SAPALSYRRLSEKPLGGKLAFFTPSRKARMHPHSVAEQLRSLGLPKDTVVVVHASYRAVAPIEGGPSGLISALRIGVDTGGTMVIPWMSDDDDAPFEVASTPCHAMGIVADTFWRRPDAVRSDNVAGFAAEGPLARAIAAPHPIAPPHGIDSPVGRVA